MNSYFNVNSDKEIKKNNDISFVNDQAMLANLKPHCKSLKDTQKDSPVSYSSTVYDNVFV